MFSITLFCLWLFVRITCRLITEADAQASRPFPEVLGCGPGPALYEGGQQTRGESPKFTQRKGRWGRSRPHYLLGPIVTFRPSLGGQRAQGGCEEMRSIFPARWSPSLPRSGHSH